MTRLTCYSIGHCRHAFSKQVLVTYPVPATISGKGYIYSHEKMNQITVLMGLTFRQWETEISKKTNKHINFK